jgi:hypothetical protein
VHREVAVLIIGAALVPAAKKGLNAGLQTLKPDFPLPVPKLQFALP